MARAPARAALRRSGPADRPQILLGIGRPSGDPTDGGRGAGARHRTPAARSARAPRDHLGGALPARRLVPAPGTQPRAALALLPRRAAARSRAALRPLTMQRHLVIFAKEP